MDLKKIKTTYFYLVSIKEELMKHKFTQNSAPITITVESDEYSYVWDSIQLATKTLKRIGINLSMLTYSKPNDKFKYTWQVSNIK